jgi:hypothetical protein
MKLNDQRNGSSLDSGCSREMGLTGSQAKIGEKWKVESASGSSLFFPL